MLDDNPFATPAVPLIDTPPSELPGWTGSQLRLLGWLSLAAVVGNALLLLLAVTGPWLERPELEALSNWFSLALALLGSYLLLRLRSLAEARFAAQGLARPVWAVVLFSLLFELLVMLIGDEGEALGWPLFATLGGLVLLGALSLWLGIRLLRVENVYPVFRLMAWLDIAGGAMLLLVLPVMLAPLPLLGALICQMLVFFRAASELKG